MTRSSAAPVLADPVAHLDAADPATRRLAVSLCAPRAGEPGVADRLAGLLAGDADPAVRAAAAEVLGGAGGPLQALLAAGDDPDPRVAEAVATALGELEHPAAVPWLTQQASANPERMVREAAVAALGAIGDPGTLPLLLGLVADGPPQVRRRTVVALTGFDDPRAVAAIRAARADRNPMVREVAEMVVGRA